MSAQIQGYSSTVFNALLVVYLLSGFRSGERKDDDEESKSSRKSSNSPESGIYLLPQ